MVGSYGKVKEVLDSESLARRAVKVIEVFAAANAYAFPTTNHIFDQFFFLADFDTTKIEANTKWRTKCATRNPIVASFKAQKCGPID